MNKTFNIKTLRYLQEKFPPGEFVATEQVDQSEFMYDTLIFFPDKDRKIVIDVTDDNAVVSFERYSQSYSSGIGSPEDSNQENKYTYPSQESEYVIDLATGSYDTSWTMNSLGDMVKGSVFPEHVQIIEDIRYFGNNALDFVMSI